MAEKTSVVNENELWSRLKKGDEPAFFEIYDTYFSLLAAYGYKLTKNTAWTEDCLQDLFSSLWEKRETLSNVTNIKAYLFKCVRTAVLKKMKASGKEMLTEEVDNYITEQVFSHEDLLVEQQLALESEQRLQNALQKLTNRQREIIFLKFSHGMGYKEIAEVTELSQQRVYNLVHEALNSLRKQLLPIVFLVVLAVFLL